MKLLTPTKPVTRFTGKPRFKSSVMPSRALIHKPEIKSKAFPNRNLRFPARFDQP